MTRRKWDNLKLGDVLQGRNGKKYVIVDLIRSKVGPIYFQSKAGPSKSNRVVEVKIIHILTATDPNQWRHVPLKER